MSLKHWAYIFVSPGFDPPQRTEVRSNQTRVVLIGIEMSKKEQVLEIAKELVKGGVQLIELCGGFGPIWVAKVLEAIQHAVPVGAVMYGPEARNPMLKILSS
jgi:2-keto-3-deoxy-6-phosphogluconate aldolase